MWAAWTASPQHELTTARNSPTGTAHAYGWRDKNKVIPSVFTQLDPPSRRAKLGTRITRVRAQTAAQSYT